MFQSNKTFFAFLLFLLGWHSGLMAALPQLPIKISSDNIFIDRKQGLSHFKGNVELTQGELKMKAQNVRVFMKGKDVEKVIIEGSPAKLEHIRDGVKVKAQANRIEYIADTEILNLVGKVHLEKGSQQFSGEQIQYNKNTQQVSAKGNGDIKSRVKAVIIPSKSETK